MTYREFEHLLSGINALSPEQVRQLRRELERRLGGSANQPAAEDEELQRRLVAAGILSEIKPPITDLTPYRNRKAVPIQGEPLSETVIRERR